MDLKKNYWLKTIKISLNTSIELSKILKDHKSPLISESGIDTPENIKFIFEKTKIYNYLIGESLLKSDSIASKMKQFAQLRL